jgi:hypothetical protein
MEEALIALLLAYAPLTALIGTSPNARLYWVRAAQGAAKPYVTLQIISRIPDMTHAGANGLNTARLQVDCYGLTYLNAKSAARAVETRLSGYRGTSSGIIFDGIFKDSERDQYESDDSTDKLFRVSMDFIIWHK